MDLDGQLIHKWALAAQPGNYAQLLPNGNLIVAMKTKEGPTHLAAKGGWMMELDWYVILCGNIKTTHSIMILDAVPTATPYISHGNSYIKSLTQGFGPAEMIRRAMKASWGDYIRDVIAIGETVWEWYADDTCKLRTIPTAHSRMVMCWLVGNTTI